MSPKHSIDIFLGLDIRKSNYQTCTLDREGNKVFDKPLPQLKSELAALFNDFQDRGAALTTAHQPKTINALPIAVARDCNCEIAYLLGLALRKAADLHPGCA
ncbi:transposase [Corynebacterium sp. HMSC061H03]|uniref:IS110 family transposase n=1 Tax=Corynebacterium sp. HMSC061H03 TaxID=1739291 RepID=UPI0008AA3FC3|nr:transposase [Corynebacterium sp. HMSC061H03]